MNLFRKCMMPRTWIAWAAISACLCLTVLSGCQEWAPKESRRGHELEKISRENRKIQTEVPADLPVRFDPIAIDKQTDEHGVHYRAVIVWRLTVAREELQALFHKLAAAKGQDAADREVIAVVLRLKYWDRAGKNCSEETVVVNLSKGAGTVHLFRLGEVGSPTRATASVAKVEFFKPRDRAAR